MIRNAASRGILMAWGARFAVVGLAALFAVVPFNARGAGKSSKPASKGKEAKAQEVPADEGSKDSAKDESAAPAAGGVKLPEQVFSTGYNGSYVELINFINAQVRQGWVDNGVRP